MITPPSQRSVSALVNRRKLLLIGGGSLIAGVVLWQSFEPTHLPSSPALTQAPAASASTADSPSLTAQAQPKAEESAPAPSFISPAASPARTAQAASNPAPFAVAPLAPVIVAHTPEVPLDAAPVLDLKGFSAPADWPQITWLIGSSSVHVALNQLAETPRLYVETKQRVETRLVFPKGRSGDRVRVEMLDGGSLSSGTPGQLLTLGDDQAVKVEAKISENGGIHRVRLTTPTASLILNFWAGQENTYQVIKM